MDITEKFELIKINTEEIVTEEDLKTLLATKSNIKAYYGIAPTGPFHISYLIPLSKVLDCIEIGIECTILIADLHAVLDDLKSSWDDVSIKAEYYKKCIELSLPIKRKVKFVLGSDYQLEKNYILDVLKVSTLMTVTRATRAASEVTRMKNPKVSELIYPIMQCLDEVALGADISIGGIDQRHIYAAAHDYLQKIGYKATVDIYTPIVSGLKGPGTKMSASIPESHIKVYDSKDAIKRKINGAYCPQAVVSNNPIMQLCQHIIFSFRKELLIERSSKFGGDLKFSTYNDLKNTYLSGELHPMDLKNAVVRELCDIFARCREYFENNRDILLALGQEFIP